MKQARKFVTSLLAVLLLFSTLTVGFAAEEQAVAVDFEDIPGIIVGNWTDTKMVPAVRQLLWMIPPAVLLALMSAADLPQPGKRTCWTLQKRCRLPMPFAFPEEAHSAWMLPAVCSSIWRKRDMA